jgi:cytochrome oxidase Cu insertion factor (SCO1/SenC/PrrC family)
LTRGERWSVGAAAVLLVVTAAWWALALWPAPAESPEWLLRTRAVCFGRTRSGLPATDGWILLVGQPLGMAGLLLAGWRDTLVAGLGKVWRSPPGRGMLGVVAAGVVLGLVAAVVRVDAARAAAWDVVDDPGAPVTGTAGEVSTVDRRAPRDRLVDQRGDSVGIGSFAGRMALVTFAFGHCETLCPVVAHRVAEARERLTGTPEPAIVVITLDPWRDTPSRLADLHRQWMLPEDARVLGGDVPTVEAALDAWRVARSRDRTTGDIVHPALVYLVDRTGVIRYATTGGVETVVELARRMEGA